MAKVEMVADLVILSEVESSLDRITGGVLLALCRKIIQEQDKQTLRQNQTDKTSDSWVLILPHPRKSDFKTIIRFTDEYPQEIVLCSRSNEIANQIRRNPVLAYLVGEPGEFHCFYSQYPPLTESFGIGRAKSIISLSEQSIFDSSDNSRGLIRLPLNGAKQAVEHEEREIFITLAAIRALREEKSQISVFSVSGSEIEEL